MPPSPHPGSSSPPKGGTIPSLAIFVLGAFLSLLVARDIAADAQHRLALLAERQTTAVATIVEKAFEQRARAVRRMAERWNEWPSLSQFEWEADAKAFLQGEPGFRYFLQIDRDVRLTWAYPPNPALPPLGAPLPTSPRDRTSLLTIMERHSDLMSSPFRLSDGEPVFAIAIPLLDQGAVRGALVAVVAAGALPAAIPVGILDDLALTIWHEDSVIFRSGQPVVGYDSVVAGASVVLGASPWRIEGRPTPALTAAVVSHTPLVVFVAGCALSALAAALLWFMMLSRMQTRIVGEREQRLDNIFAAVTDGLIVIDEHGIIQNVNPAVTRLFGYDLAELSGQNVSLLMPEPHRSRHDGYLGRYRQAGEPRIIGKGGREVTGLHKNGRMISVHLSVSETWVGERRLFTGLLRDLTAEHVAADALKTSEARFRSAFEGAAIGIALVEAFGVVIDVNPVLERMLGFSRDEMIGRSWLDWIHPDDAPRDTERFVALLRGQVSRIDLDIRCRDRGGSTIFTEMALASVRPRDDVKPFFLASVLDVSERKRAEAEIRRLSRAVEQSSAIVVITNPLGIIEYVNPRFIRVTGYAADEVLGRTPSILKSPSTDPAVHAALWRTISAGRVWNGEIENLRKDGSEYVVLSSISPVLDEHGALTHFVAVQEDITERRKADVALRQAKEAAETANRAKSEFLSAMSHELRTPMNAILGFAQLLESSRKDPLSDKQKSHVQHIMKAGHHLLSLINEVLDLARIEAGHLDLSITAADSRRLLDECLGLARPLAEPRGIVIVDRTAERRLPVLDIDPTRVKQVLVNLLSNAIKYNRDHGRVTIEAAIEGSHLRLMVSDTGPGIPPAKQAELFQPFSRLGAEHGPAEGTGIGLTITKRLVEAMDGTIGFTSQEGTGSTFWVSLPLATPAADAMPPLRSTP